MQSSAYAISATGDPLDYSRMDALGYPVLGAADFVPDDELRRTTKLQHRFGYGTFNTHRRNERIYHRTYGEVMEGIKNRNFVLCYRSEPVRRKNGSVDIYIEWYEPLMILQNEELPARIELDEESTDKSEPAKATVIVPEILESELILIPPMD